MFRLIALMVFVGYLIQLTGFISENKDMILTVCAVIVVALVAYWHSKKKNAANEIESITRDMIEKEVGLFLSYAQHGLEPIYSTDIEARKAVKEYLSDSHDGTEYDMVFTIYLHSEILVMREFVIKNYKALVRDFKMNVRSDAYGHKDTGKWDQILYRIVENQLADDVEIVDQDIQNQMPSIKTYEPTTVSQLSGRDRKEYIKELAKMLSGQFDVEHSFQQSNDDLETEYGIEEIENPNEATDGFDYEHRIAALINGSTENWIAEVTQGSGDQGADIIIEHVETDDKIAIQCKFYSTPVGNKAVQEVIAGSIHYGANFRMVVTNNSYTRSANELAESAAVVLATTDTIIADLDDLDPHA